MSSLIGEANQPAGRPNGAGDAAQGSAAIKDSDLQHFAQDVIEASMERPVLVDFWATWCGPCKTLGPLLEKVVTEARGAVRLVKIDIDKNQSLAQQLRIQSVPTVYAFFQGQPVDGFQGALPESQLKTFVERLIQMTGAQPDTGGVDVAELLRTADAKLAEGATAEAEALYLEALQADGENAAAIAGLLRARIQLGDKEGAREMLDSLEDAMRAKPEIAAVATALELSGRQVDSSQIAELAEKVALDPKDHAARFELAQVLYAGGREEEAAEHLLEIVRLKRDWNEEAARKELVKYFEAWGPTSELTLDFRRRLSSLLFA
ncbi:thioredoxin [Tistlia consotensis]|uniref:Thioredoxin n=1 Tax=Tistlia consotensis USBA 355 TaxID=560819 RepID=A0A1Y6BH18_9PROT|nr:thioredoxin [Tistlia consotensis]SMF09560.1 thioredoxin [Tistlia consotensis USBA 355]SNR34412.1 thioredoxin [Tistlia consotensis]